MLSGYFRRPDISAKSIQNGWYHTGDMGYIAGGELYITGRKKDLIIVGGKNIYPQDIEAIANEVSGIVPGRSVAFGLFDPSLGSENIVMVCELDNGKLSPQQIKGLETELRRRVLQQSDVALTDIRFVEKRWLIKTSSGKISRSSNREKYIQEFKEE
jgi:acyl-CoA synthetase (AMP-forming)/AMP-acid ligase II